MIAVPVTPGIEFNLFIVAAGIEVVGWACGGPQKCSVRVASAAPPKPAEPPLYQTADRTEAGLRIVREPARCDEGGGPVRAPGDQARAQHGQPRSGDHEAGHDQQYATEEQHGFDGRAGAAVGADVMEVGEVAEFRDAGEQRDEPPRAGWARYDPTSHAERRYGDAPQR
jgi:hypothetical protein